MLLLCHLAAGLLIGLVLFWICHDPKLIIPAVIGGIASDLIDKPIGHILLQQSLDNGRIYAHGLLFFGIILICGILIWIQYHSLVGISFSLGVLSHQFLDRMYNDPENWLYPFKGPFTSFHQENYFGNAIFRELFNPYEWIFALLILIILSFSISFILDKENWSEFGNLHGFGSFISFCGGISGFILFFPQSNTIGMALTGYNEPVDIYLAAFVMVLTAIFAGILLNRNRFSR